MALVLTSASVRARAASTVEGAAAAVSPVDRYTLGHAALGFTMGLWGAPWYVTLLTTLGFELVEDRLKRTVPGLFPVGKPDTIANSFLDSTAWMGGWAVAQLLPPAPAKIWRRR